MISVPTKTTGIIIINIYLFELRFITLTISNIKIKYILFSVFIYAFYLIFNTTENNENLHEYDTIIIC